MNCASPNCASSGVFFTGRMCSDLGAFHSDAPGRCTEPDPVLLIPNSFPYVRKSCSSVQYECVFDTCRVRCKNSALHTLCLIYFIYLLTYFLTYLLILI